MLAAPRGRSDADDPGPDRGWTPPVDRLFPELHAVLGDNLRRLEAGIGGLVVVAGEPGVGKAWAVDAVRGLHRGTSLIGRASAATHDIPLWPLHQTLAGRAERERPHSLQGTVEDINAVVATLAAYGRDAPTVLGVHRLDCADSATLAVLEALAAEDIGGVLCVATVQSEPSTPAHEFVDALLEHDLAVRVDLRPVSDDAVREVVLQLFGARIASDDLVGRIVYLAGGLPRLAERIVRSAQRRGVLRAADGEWLLDGTLDDALPLDAASQVDRALVVAGAETRDVSVAAAVLGTASLVDLADVTALGLDVLDDAARRGVELGLLRRVGETVVPRTGLVRDAVLHALIARTSTDVLDRLVAAASFAGSRSQGFDRAVDMLERVGLTDAASNYRLRMASRSLDEGRVLNVEAQLAAVRPDDVAVADRIVHAGLCLRTAALAGADPDQVEAAWRHLTSAVPEVARTSDVLLVRSLAWTDLGAALTRGRALPRRAGTDPFADAWIELLEVVAAPVESRAEALEAALSRWVDHVDVTCAARRHLAALRSPDRPEDVLDLLDRARQLASGGGDPIELRRVGAAYAQHELLRGSTSLAVSSAARAMCDDGDRVVGGSFQIDASLALAWAGKGGRAAAQLAEVFQATRAVAPAVAARALVARAGVAAVGGNLADVEQLLGAAGALTPDDPGHRDAALALAALAVDDLDGAIARWAPGNADPGVAGVAETQWSWLGHAIPLVELVAGRQPRTVPDPWSWTSAANGWDALVRAAQLGATGHAEAALRELVAGDDALTPFPVQQVLARRLVCELSVRDGWASRTVELALRASLARCATGGLTALEARCRSILRAGRYAVPRYGDAIADVPIDLRTKGVTTREMEVVRLLLGGASTADAAKALFVSDATIKSHVSNAMRKLGYASREQLLAGLADS